jgi:tetratricopeptide (TPR) repeat protein
MTCATLCRTGRPAGSRLRYRPCVGAVIAVGLAGLASWAGSPHAQASDAAYADAFAARIASPGDVSVLSTFINLAVQRGQYDQAVSTVEQHLIAAPRDARARLVAARLYHHMGSYELARRQARHALSIGTLTPEETQDAEALLARAERALSGWTYGLAVSGGIRFESTERANAADEDFTTGFGQLQGYVRQDLKTATRDALIYSGRISATERVYDTDLTRTAGRDTYLSGLGRVTYDKGLPNSGVESLRMLVSAFGAVESFGSNTDETRLGTDIKFTARPTVDGLAFVSAGYANLEGSDGIFTEDRFSWEAGYSHRLPNGHAIGAAVRGTQDSGTRQSDLGHSTEFEVRYGGVVLDLPDRVVWLHEVAVAVGEDETPDLTLGPASRLQSDFWRITSAHDFQLTSEQKISLDMTYTERKFSILERSSFAATLYYTYAIE